MHFSIIKGEGTPILFESGAGNDGSVWKAIARDVHDVTGTTVIYYDRSGFGTSELNLNHKYDAEFGIDNGILELEKGLKKLGYFNDLILVSHSYGGFYTTLFSSRNSNKVLYNVRVDANLGGQYTEDILIKAEQYNSVSEMKDKNLGMYYLGVDFTNTVRLLQKVEYPKPFPQLILFLQFKDNPGLVLNAIVKGIYEHLRRWWKKTRDFVKICWQINGAFYSRKKERKGINNAWQPI